MAVVSDNGRNIASVGGRVERTLTEMGHSLFEVRGASPSQLISRTGTVRVASMDFGPTITRALSASSFTT